MFRSGSLLGLHSPHLLEAGQFGGQGPGTQADAGMSLTRRQACSRQALGSLAVFPLVPWIREPIPAQEVQRVDPHVAGEQHIEAAEPEQLATVAGHGSLGGREEWFWSWCLAVCCFHLPPPTCALQATAGPGFPCDLRNPLHWPLVAASCPDPPPPDIPMTTAAGPDAAEHNLQLTTL